MSNMKLLPNTKHKILRQKYITKARFHRNSWLEIKKKGGNVSFSLCFDPYLMTCITITHSIYNSLKSIILNNTLA